MKQIDTFLDRITMYRLLVYGLLAIAGLALVLTLTGRLAFTPVQFVLSGVVILGVRFAVDQVFLRLFNVPANLESGLITGLILLLILQPATSVADALCLALAGFIASAGKFILAYRGKHIFNPAALAAAVLSVSGLYTVSWWVGNSAMWPLALVVGLAVVRKTRRSGMVLAFAAAAILLQAVLLAAGHKPVLDNMHYVVVSSPLIFLATIMLTEPSTMPPRRLQQVIFAVGVGVLYATSWKLGPVDIYPEVALLVGNIYAFAVSLRYRLRLKLVEIQKISDRVYNYVFHPDKPVSFLPGQYMEWTLGGVPYDSRGNRRTFTIASSPTEDTVQLGLKYYQPASSFKITFIKLKPGDIVHAGRIAGDFTLGGNVSRKLVFIAGGIGITPFRSMAKYLSDAGTKCDIILLYVVSDASELAYEQEFTAARSVGIKLVPIFTRLSPDLITAQVPDYAERIFYISGPHGMVETTANYLHDLRVPRRRIKTDHFSGY